MNARDAIEEAVKRTRERCSVAVCSASLSLPGRHPFQQVLSATAEVINRLPVDDIIAAAEKFLSAPVSSGPAKE
jgi:hypothetical protein